MRPTWFASEHARVATSREGVSLVTSGGLDGNGPGVWGLLRHSVIVGVSKNNVHRWGPCGELTSTEGPGCVDWNSQSTTIFEKGYPSPAWNFAGFYIYDGPVRIHDVRFVNFRRDPTQDSTRAPTAPLYSLLTDADVAIQKTFTKYPNNVTVYEGDAALGWFQNNQSAYPVATEVSGLKFDNVDLRHQVFTEKVNFGNFDDGDKNTAIIDRDGSLTGFTVVTAAQGGIKPAVGDFPISLNNLPFNASSNAVDECSSEGAQDTLYEGRPTSLISPGNMGTLEFEAFQLPYGDVPPPPPATVPPTYNALTQLVTFTKDTLDYHKHQSMQMHSRNNQGIWEPKVTSGLGYTITAQDVRPGTFPQQARPAGIPYSISVGLTDVVKPRITKQNPFVVRVGVCYTNKGTNTHPDAKGGKFKITRGYRSWGGNGADPTDCDLRKKFNFLDLMYQDERCFNLAAQTPFIMNDEAKGCPAHGIVLKDDDAACPDGSVLAKDRNNFDVCAFPKTELKEALAFPELTHPDGTPNDTDKYYYDPNTGMLFFYVKQERPNAQGTSPLGSCANGATEAACPDGTTESYYTCPPEGCVSYSVRLSKTVAYDPGPSACVGTDPQAIYTYKTDPAATKGLYEQDPPTNVNQLAFKAAPPGQIWVVEPYDNTANALFPHRQAMNEGKLVSKVCTGDPGGPALGSNAIVR